MTTPDTAAKQTKTGERFRLPDPPQRESNDMTSFDQLSGNGNAYHLKQHLIAHRPAERDSILVSGEYYMVNRPTRYLGGSRYPDLLVAFGADPEAYRLSNGYILEEQGKPPDFVLEIASERTGRVDVGAKRDDYERLQIPEYWRFDETETGRYHGARLGGDILVDGQYRPAAIEEVGDGALQGYSPMLDLYLRWERGELALIDPATGRRIATFEDERDRADREREARIEVWETRAAVEVECNTERDVRLAAEARANELDEMNRRLRGGRTPANCNGTGCEIAFLPWYSKPQKRCSAKRTAQC